MIASSTVRAIDGAKCGAEPRTKYKNVMKGQAAQNTKNVEDDFAINGLTPSTQPSPAIPP